MLGQKTEKTKPVPGHKCGGALVGFEVKCECGWRSVTHYGKGARGQAYAEWHWHVDQHKKIEDGVRRLRECGISLQEDGGEVNGYSATGWIGRWPSKEAAVRALLSAKPE